MTMRQKIARICGAQRLGNQGVALPLALLGLLLVSILVTGMLVTSSMEAAMSRAHQDGVRSLYSAENALERVLGKDGGRIEPGTHKLNGYDVSVVLLADSVSPPVINSDHPWAHQRLQKINLLSVPELAQNGRSIGLLARTLTHFIKLDTDIDGAMTVGGQLVEVKGNVNISNQASDASCGTGGHAIVLDEVSAIDTTGNVTIEGGVSQREVDAKALLAQSLGVDELVITDLAKFADIKFGTIGEETHPAFSGSPRADGDYDRDHNLNWGCPTGLVVSCEENEYSAHAPVVAIDASASGTQSLNNHHGQGMLVIINSEGNNRIEIGGNFSYEGIVLVDGSVKVSGTPRIHGALMVMGDGQIDATASTTGRVDIRYDACAIATAEEAFTRASETGGPPVEVRRMGWFEVVR